MLIHRFRPQRSTYTAFIQLRHFLSSGYSHVHICLQTSRGQWTLAVLLQGNVESKIYGRWVNESYTYEYATNEVLNGRSMNITMYYVDLSVQDVFKDAFCEYFYFHRVYLLHFNIFLCKLNSN